LSTFFTNLLYIRFVDLGPEGGAAGGNLIAEGTPQQVAQIDNSYTGKGLREMM